MTVLVAMILGLIQGLTEFLPVSSSGHLALFGPLIGLSQADLIFDIVVHTGTLVAIVWFYRQRLWSLFQGILQREGTATRYVVQLAIATVPAAVLGLSGKAWIVAAHNHLWVVGCCLIFTGLVLLGSRPLLRSNSVGETLSFGSALGIGFAQALAVFPGISRSGMTIVAGLWFGLQRKAAAQFAFLMAIPAIGGATILAFLDLYGQGGATQVLWAPYLAGFFVSAVVSFAALTFLNQILEQNRFSWFGVYCLVLGLGTLCWFL
jgi:undecaprenyl-diphosphatase